MQAAKALDGTIDLVDAKPGDVAIFSAALPLAV